MDSSENSAPKMAPQATARSVHVLSAKAERKEWYCDVCNVVFSSAQALGGHRGNSSEHILRVQALRKEGKLTLMEPEGKGKAAWGLVSDFALPEPYEIGCQVEVLYDDGVWYAGVLEKGPRLRNGSHQFMISFDDGEDIWTALPAKDVRPAPSGWETRGKSSVPQGTVLMRDASNKLDAPDSMTPAASRKGDECAERRDSAPASLSVSLWYCKICDIEFSSGKALGGHKGNSAEHARRVQELLRKESRAAPRADQGNVTESEDAESSEKDSNMLPKPARQEGIIQLSSRWPVRRRKPTARFTAKRRLVAIAKRAISEEDESGSDSFSVSSADEPLRDVAPEDEWVPSRSFRDASLRQGEDDNKEGKDMDAPGAWQEADMQLGFQMLGPAASRNHSDMDSDEKASNVSPVCISSSRSSQQNSDNFFEESSSIRAKRRRVLSPLHRPMSQASSVIKQMLESLAYEPPNTSLRKEAHEVRAPPLDKRGVSYQRFMKEEIHRLKKDPTLTHREAFKLAASNWTADKLQHRKATRISHLAQEQHGDSYEDNRGATSRRLGMHEGRTKMFSEEVAHNLVTCHQENSPPLRGHRARQALSRFFCS